MWGNRGEKAPVASQPTPLQTNKRGFLKYTFVSQYSTFELGVLPRIF